MNIRFHFKYIVVSQFLLYSALLPHIGCAQEEKKIWPPTEGIPMTRWGAGIKPENPVLPEYPRPQMTRENWLNLNGRWDCAITERGAASPTHFDGKILVPFAIESVLSQVNKHVDPSSQLWYHRTFKIPEAWLKERILLHFGGVDWETSVILNGRTVGAHRGGYDDFTVDITRAIITGDSQDLVVSVWDPTEGGQPRGKQSSRPGGTFYTPTTGIWQTVWLEPVPNSHIENLKIVPSIDDNTVKITEDATEPSGLMAEAVVKEMGILVGKATGAPGESLVVSIPNARYWWPQHPALYDLTVTLKQGSKTVDSVGSYFGMRKISVGLDEEGSTRILLNNKFIFQNGMLDQGFWPDGVYTAPSDEALRYDIEMAKALGFNLLRKYFKVEPDRWYYWADKLGILVWQDMPSSPEMGHGKKEYVQDTEETYELELRRMIQGRFNHPSVVMWIIFDEGRGLTDEKQMLPDNVLAVLRAREERMLKAVREEDATRLVDVQSGTGTRGKEGLLDCGLGDVIDFHAYSEQLPDAEGGRAAVVGAYGWGSAAEWRVPQFLSTFGQKRISGMVLTQLTDVETECNNGRMKYDRTLKGDSKPEEIGAKIIEALHEAGYPDYPGGGGESYLQEPP
jgi:beta-galactosidase/beta-glucuronidase